MLYQPQPGGLYGGYVGNVGATQDLVYRGEPTQMMPLPYYGGGLVFNPWRAPRLTKIRVFQ